MEVRFDCPKAANATCLLLSVEACRMSVHTKRQPKLYWASPVLIQGGVWQTVRAALIKERSRLFEGLQKISFLEPFPSQANFVLCRVHGHLSAKQVKDTLAQDYGIMVRHYAKKELSGFIRISVGKPEHTDAVLQALAAIANSS